jgi:uncharacterized protein YigE (DUF2233 family)
VSVADAKGNVEQKVIDPSLFDSPVSIAKWVGKMDAAETGSPRNVFSSPNNIFYVDGSKAIIQHDDDGLLTEESFTNHRKKIELGNR